MEMMKRIATITLVVLLAGAMLVPVSVFAESGQVFKPGHKPVDINIYKVPGKSGAKKRGANASYPAKLDPREEEWYKQNIHVRNQANTNLCWAFSATSAAQISYAKEINRSVISSESSGNGTSKASSAEKEIGTASSAKGKDDFADAIKNVGQLSPAHLGYFFYNHVNDPLGNTPGDINPVDKSWIDDGGACYYTQLHMATWSGLADEELIPFRRSYTRRTKFNNNLAYKDVLTQENTIVYDELDTSTEAKREESIKTVKGLLSEYGAVVVSIDYEDEYFNNEKAFFNKKYTSNNHEVTIVGWDDDYERGNFDSNGAKPRNGGAWIVMNSWGENSNDGGYFYVSYESKDILADGIVAFDMQLVDPEKLNFQYDGSANNSSLDLDAGDSYANVFEVPANTKAELTDICFEELNDGESAYTIEIYKNLTDRNDPTSGTRACSFETTTQTPGYKTVPLKDSVNISSNETENYSIVVTYKSKGVLGCENDCEYDEDDKEYYETGAEIKEGQSFVSKPGGAWEDLYKEDDVAACARIKGIATNIHDWSKVNYEWSDDNRKVAASRECLDDASLNQSETVRTIVVTKEATCVAKGETTYTAEFENKAFETQTKTVDIATDPSVHVWESPKYEWTADNSEVTATRTCQYHNDAKDTESVSTTSVVTKPATCEANGETTFTAEFENKAFKTQTKTAENIDALGHEYGDWKTLNDKQHQRVCAHDNKHVEKENHKWNAGVITKEPTCTAKGVKQFKCTVCNGTKTEEVNALGHDLVKHDEATATFDPKGLATYWSCRRCNKLFSDEQGRHEATLTAVREAIKEAKWNGVPDNKLPKVRRTKVKSGKRSMKITWKKLSKKQRKACAKIEIQYSMDKKFPRKKTVTKNVRKTKKSFRVTKLRSKKRYYVKLRTIKTIKGVKHVSKWSPVKKVTIR